MRQQNGYTVFELVVYIALLAMLLIISSASAISAYRAFGVMRVERQIILEGDAAMETMIRDIRNATSTNAASSVFASHPGALDLNSVKFSLSGATIQRTAGGIAQSLTARTRVTSLIFYYATSTSPKTASEIITIRATLAGGEGFFMRTKNFFGSAAVRGTY